MGGVLLVNTLRKVLLGTRGKTGKLELAAVQTAVRWFSSRKEAAELSLRYTMVMGPGATVGLALLPAEVLAHSVILPE